MTKEVVDILKKTNININIIEEYKKLLTPANINYIKYNAFTEAAKVIRTRRLELAKQQAHRVCKNQWFAHIMCEKASSRKEALKAGARLLVRYDGAKSNTIVWKQCTQIMCGKKIKVKKTTIDAIARFSAWMLHQNVAELLK